jgi:hypothetical protein
VFLQANCPAWLCREQIVSPMANCVYPTVNKLKNVDPLFFHLSFNVSHEIHEMQHCVGIEISVFPRLILVGALEHFLFFHSVGDFIIPTDERHHFSEG